MAATFERKMVDEIRAYIQSPDQTKSPALEDLARRYAKACQTVNDRLSRCAEFLEKGLRTQALQLAETEPELLGVVGALTFPELAAWQELSAMYGLERLAPLRTDVAASIKEAYEIERRLAPLLREHRRLAISQATVKERLGVLRQIAALDPKVDYWRVDISVFERQRVTELMGLARAARQSNDPNVMGQMITDFEAEEWQTAVPPDLTREYIGLARHLHETYTFPPLTHHIAAAMARQDVPRLEELERHWNQSIHSLRKYEPGWYPPTQWQLAVQPAFAFLNEYRERVRQSRFDHDMHSLVQAMRSEKDEEHVQGLLTNVEAYGYALPPIVSAEVEEFKRSALEARLLAWGVKGALFVGGIVVLAIAFFVLRGMFSRG